MSRVANEAERVGSASAPIAVFTALTWESAAVRAGLREVRREGDRVWRGWAGDYEVLVLASGIGPRRAQHAVDRLADAPLAAIVSAGCAGALCAGLVPGQLVLASDVRMFSPESALQLTRFPVHGRLLAQARTAASWAAVPGVEGPVFTSTRVLCTPTDKVQCGERTGAIAVDMESGIQATYAMTRRLPFLALRVILDPIEMALPIIPGLTTPDGEIRSLKAVAHAATHPSQLSVLFALRRARATAATVLTRFCRAFFPLLKRY